MNKHTFLFLLVFTISVSANSITFIDIGGADYEIVEKNIANIMKDSVLSNKDKIQEKLKEVRKKLKVKLANYKPKDLTKIILPATKNRTHYPETLYTVKNDIKDNNGKILYHKGYQFNPLHYITLTDRYVFFDYANKSQVSWIKKNKLDKDITMRLIITNGKIFEAIKYFGREVFYANDLLLEKFEIWATPSIVVQEGDRIKVNEFYISTKKEEK